MKKVFLSILIAAVVCGQARPAKAAQAVSNAQYSIAMTQLYSPGGPYTGSLKITVSGDGIVSGYYFPSDGSAMFVPVVGGRSGNSIWFDIGSSDLMHVDGRFSNGAIVGTALSSSNDPYAFVATPAAANAR